LLLINLALLLIKRFYFTGWWPFFPDSAARFGRVNGIIGATAHSSKQLTNICRPFTINLQ
jgi:hypothetical protein